jgi:hypothetical protein
MNPPYGRKVGLWVTKLHDSFTQGTVTEAIALLPARVDTRWFRILRDYPVCFVNGRLKFSASGPAPFPSAVFYLGNDLEKFNEAFNNIGDVYVRLMEGK